MSYGVQAAKTATRSIGGVPAGMFFFLGAIALLSAAGDTRMLVRGGVFGVHRIARHLWRMCFSLFIATGSFFLGQQQVFPHWLRKTNVLFIPAILPLILLIFWLVRVLFTNAFKGTVFRNMGSQSPRASEMTADIGETSLRLSDSLFFWGNPRQPSRTAKQLKN